jgi:hypothetical protein
MLEILMSGNLCVGLLGALVVGSLAFASAPAAQPCGAWSYGNSTPNGFVVAAGGGTVVIATAGGVLASHDGGAWRWAAVPEFNQGTRVAWGSGRFAAIASTTILISEDGLAWRRAATLREPAPKDISSNGSMFVALGPYFVSTSADGLAWETRPNGLGPTYLETVRWAGSLWIATELHGLYTSPDGLKWSPRGPDVDFKTVAWNGNEYLAFGLDIKGETKAVLATSPDGVEWTVRPADDPWMSDLATDGHVWVASASGPLLVSADGLSWNPVEFTPSLGLQRVVWTGTAFVAVGPGGTATSADGTTWAGRPAVDFRTATWTGSRFVALGVLHDGAEGAAFLSLDGLVWTGASVPPEESINGVVQAAEGLVAVGSSGAIYVSADGDVWERRGSGTVGSTALADVTFNGSQILAVGFGGEVFMSPDGANWTEAAHLDGLVSGVTWSQGLFIAIGSRSDAQTSCLAVWTSRDGVEWADQGIDSGCGAATQCSFSLAAVTASETRFVAAGGSYCQGQWPNTPTTTPVLLTSADGAHWSPADLSPISSNASPVESVVWTSAGFVGVSGGLLITSPDGLSWTLDAQFVGNAAAVAGNGRGLVAVGGLGSTAWSDCAAPPPFGQPGVMNTAVVTAAQAPGLSGTQWVTDLELFNPAAAGAPGVLYYLPRDTDNTASMRRPVTVPAGQAIRLGDVVGQYFGLARSAGSLVVSCAQPLVVTSRTYTASAGGTLGQFVPGLGEGAAVRAGDQARLIQLTENAAYRTNIGFESVTPTPVDVTVDLYEAGGAFLGTRTFTLQPFGSAQATEILPQIGVDAVDDAYAVVHSNTPGASFFTYAAVVDNSSGDSITVLPGPASSEEPLYVPAVAHNSGLHGTQWRADLEVHNPGAVQARYTLELLKAGQDNSTPASAAFTLDPAMSRRYGDVVQDVFGFEGSGAIRVTPTSGTVIVTGRSYTDSGGGTRGQFMPGTPASQASAGGVGARLIQLTQTADFRTNIGLVNATAVPLTVEITLYAAGGTWLGSKTLGLAPYEFVQETEILRTVTPNDVTDGFAVVSSVTPGARFFAYASVVDNRSGDPIYVIAQ